MTKDRAFRQRGARSPLFDRLPRPRGNMFDRIQGEVERICQANTTDNVPRHPTCRVPSRSTRGLPRSSRPSPSCESRRLSKLPFAVIALDRAVLVLAPLVAGKDELTNRASGATTSWCSLPRRRGCPSCLHSSASALTISGPPSSGENTAAGANELARAQEPSGVQRVVGDARRSQSPLVRGTRRSPPAASTSPCISRCPNASGITPHRSFLALTAGAAT
jgi:hypothetical protein